MNHAKASTFAEMAGMRRADQGDASEARARFRRPLVFPVFLIVACFIVTSFMVPWARAGQSLIATPYPSAVGSGQPLNTDPVETRGPQQLRPDPYPQIMGDDAQGNPPITRRHRHQRLVPSIYQRKYRVDRR